MFGLLKKQATWDQLVKGLFEIVKQVKPAHAFHARWVFKSSLNNPALRVRARG